MVTVALVISIILLCLSGWVGPWASVALHALANMPFFATLMLILLVVAIYVTIKALVNNTLTQSVAKSIKNLASKKRAKKSKAEK